MKITPELLRVLEADLGKGYNPLKALDFLRSLRPENKNLPEAQRLETLLEKPPAEDVCLQIIYETAFVRGEIVAAGKKTRAEFPLTRYHPIHFKKTYLQKMSRWETSPLHEEKMSKMAWSHFQEEGKHHQVPLPLGSTGSTFRSELIEARSLGSLSPIHNGGDPAEIVEQILAARKNKEPLKKLWQGMEALLEAMDLLHSAGMLHHDAHRENLLIAFSEEKETGYLIDFETLEEDDRFGSMDWNAACKEDCSHLFEEAALIELCAQAKELPQDTKLGKEARRYGERSPKIMAIHNLLAKKERTVPLSTLPSL